MSTHLETFSYTAPSQLPRSRVHPWVRGLARSLWSLGAIVVLGLALAPWQQSVSGSGRVIAYAPTDRTQFIEAPIKGRIVTWHVQEGSHVEVGDAVADIADNDPQILERLEREQQAAKDNVRAAETVVAVAEARIAALTTAREAALANARLYVQIAEDKTDAARQELEAATAEAKTAQLNRDRQRRMLPEGLTSQRNVEVADLKVETTRSKREAAEAKLRAAKREASAARAKLDNVSSKETAEITKAEEALQKLKSERAKAKGDLAKTEVKVTRQQSMRITAPIAGTVLRLIANGPGEFVKAGDRVATIVPDTASRAVELWVSGNDAPLIRNGSSVRLQFEGWPAVQFVGWPSVAVGTFGGRVAFSDATDDGSGKFRIVVVPDPGEEPWPDAAYLRQGVRANGWVLLNEVRVGYELWRQLNGFPPAVDAPSSTGRNK